MPTNPNIRYLPLEHRGFYGTIQYDKENHTYHGRILGTLPTEHTSYRADSPEDLLTVFTATVDNYYQNCEQRGITERRDMITDPRARFFATARNLVEMAASLDGTDTDVILPNLRKAMDQYLSRPTDDLTNEYPSGLYNIHRLTQHTVNLIHRHLLEYGTLSEDNATLYLPLHIPDLPSAVVTLDFGMKKEVYPDGYSSLRQHLASIVCNKEVEYLGTALMETYQTHPDGRKTVTDEFIVQFPDIL